MKNKMLGIPVALFVIGLLVAASATAMLVTYLSNTVTMSTTVSSPLVMTGDVNIAPTIYGGEVIHYEVTTKNLANASIWSFPVTEVSSSTAFTGNEFTQINLTDPSGTYDVTTLMDYVNDAGVLKPLTDLNTATDIANKKDIKLVFSYGGGWDATKGYIRTVGFDELNKVDITLASNFAGDLTIKSCQLYSLSGSC